METNKPLTLEEAKDAVAEKDGYPGWQQIAYHLYDEYYRRAAELYKSSHVSALQAEIEALRKEREWISVDEMLPEDHKYVLAHLSGGGMGRAVMKNGFWYFWYYEGYGIVNCDPYVTHWQPLTPKP